MSKVEAHLTSYSGPLPPSEELKRYNDIIPGAAERILRMAEVEQTHRHQEESRYTKHTVRTTYLAIILAFIVVVILSSVILYAIYKGLVSQWIASTFTAIAAVVGAFMCVRLYKSSAREKR